MDLDKIVWSGLASINRRDYGIEKNFSRDSGIKERYWSPSFNFCREVFSFAASLFFSPWGFSFAASLFLSAVRFFLFAMKFFLLSWVFSFLPWGSYFFPWVFFFCRVVIAFALTVLGHRRLKNRISRVLGSVTIWRPNKNPVRMLLAWLTDSILNDGM